MTMLKRHHSSSSRV